MCVKRSSGRGWQRCAKYEECKEAAVSEWCYAMTQESVLAAWGRFGGLVTSHRHGREHYQRIGAKGGRS